MRKIIKIIAFIAISISAVSCSSDSDGGGDSQATNTFSLNYDGANINITEMVAQKSENSLVVYGTGSDGTGIQFEFNKFGNLGAVSTYNVDDFDFVDSYNYRDYSSNYFTFTLISINESTKRVKVSYSGLLYENEEDLSSNSVEVSGSFDLTYIENTPLIAGLETSCKINGNDWYSTKFWDNGWFDVDRKCISDDDVMLAFKFEDQYIEAGTYNFTPTSQNKVVYYKFNTTTKTYDEYDCTGSLIVTANTEGINFNIIEGTFSLTATNPSSPSQQISITNGRFKSNF